MEIAHSQAVTLWQGINCSRTYRRNMFAVLKVCVISCVIVMTNQLVTGDRGKFFAQSFFFAIAKGLGRHRQGGHGRPPGREILSF